MRYVSSTLMSPKQVMEAAELAFGRAGLGLEVVERRHDGLKLAGPQGSVNLTIEPVDGTNEVFLSTEGLDLQVRQFMAEIFEERHLHSQAEP